MSRRLKKVLLIFLAASLLAGSGFLQTRLNHDRDKLGLTHVEGLTNAPPVLAFTTVALGGFRGLISNLLWIRESELQENDKFFEMAQLSDWITKLEPHFSMVWVHEAWNMAYNVSVKFKDYPDRWRWVQNGIELLRDQGLRYNPDDVLIHRELAWFFQHKMGANLDDANMYYKTQWKQEMENLFGGKEPNFEALMHPKTVDETNRARLLSEKYKMNPAFMKRVEDIYGPLEWRLPEAHAIYWACEGLERATNDPSRMPTDDLIILRRVIYQSMALAFQRGRIVDNPFSPTNEIDFGPNLDVYSKANDVDLEMYKEETDPAQKEGVLRAHRNFLRLLVYTLYEYNRIPEAAKWFKILGEKYPDKTIIDGDPNSYPRNVTLDQYALACVQVDINETDRNKVRAAVEGLLVESYLSLAVDDDDRAAGLRAFARRIRDNYESKISKDRIDPIGLPPFAEIDGDIRKRLLDPETGLRPEIRAKVLTKIGPSSVKVPSTPETPLENSGRQH